MDYFSDVPTFQESGMTTMSVSLWNGILAPARTPASIIQRLNAEIRNAAAAPELNRVLGTQGTSAVSSTSDEFAAFIKAERERYAVIVKDSGARAD